MLGDKLYVGGGFTSGSHRNQSRLYIYIPTTDTWTTLDTPVDWFSLVTYHNEVVLVGGRNYVGEHRAGLDSNQLWTLDEQKVWQINLPPMNVRRSHVSAVNYREYLLVAGGQNDGKLCNVVEIYNDQTWSTAEPLPKPCQSMKSAVLDGCWYLMGGTSTIALESDYFCDVYFASMDSLLASCQPSETETLQPSWKRLIDVPHSRSIPAIIGNRLTTIGGTRRDLQPISSIHAFSQYTNSWVNVGNLPAAGCDICAMVLPTREIIVIGGFVNDTSQIFKATFEGWCVLFVIPPLIHILFFFSCSKAI